jgi:hypothetical protein
MFLTPPFIEQAITLFEDWLGSSTSVIDSMTMSAPPLE